MRNGSGRWLRRERSAAAEAADTQEWRRFASPSRQGHLLPLEEAMTETMTAQAALDRLETLYTQSVANLRGAVRHFLATGERADAEARARGLFSYPSLKISWFGDRPDEPSHPRLCPDVAPGRLFHHRHPARPVPVLSAGTADPAGTGLWRDLRGRAVGTGNPLPLCAGRVRRGAQPVADGGDRPLFPDHRPGPHRRRNLRRPVRPGRGLPSVAVRRPAHRLLAGPAAPLHRHPGRGRPVLCPVHQLQPLCR
jgi:hypothetical protein